MAERSVSRRRYDPQPAAGGRGVGQAHGFTLIEMMAVVVIVGILAAAAAPRFYRAVMEGHMEEAKPHLMAIAAKERAYYRRNGSYYVSANENDLATNLGVELKDVGNFCFATVTIRDDMLETNSLDTEFEVWAILRNSLGTGAATCTPATGKAVAGGWIGSSGLGSAGRVVVLRYPPKSGSGGLRRGQGFALQWTEGISTTDPMTSY